MMIIYCARDLFILVPQVNFTLICSCQYIGVNAISTLTRHRPHQPSSHRPHRSGFFDSHIVFSHRTGACLHTVMSALEEARRSCLVLITVASYASLLNASWHQQVYYLLWRKWAGMKTKWPTSNRVLVTPARQQNQVEFRLEQLE